MPNEQKTTATKITIEVGTAYDFFLSLNALQSPKKFGIRGAWASGMLARLTAESRETLQRIEPFGAYPMHYLPGVPEPKNAESLLWSLKRLEPVARLRALGCPWKLADCGCPAIFEEVAERGGWKESDLKRLGEALRGDDEYGMSEKNLAALLDIWSDPEGFGEAYFSALRNYYDVFFAEEEKRIRPAIEAAGERIANLVGKIPLSDLIEEISSGVRYEALPDLDELVLAPSYWVTPLLMTVHLGPKSRLLVFGARPAGDSIVPGETVPDSLVHALKALSDPTRLRILRIVAGQPVGAAELARSLRLRTPTVLHHIHALRLSGLIRIQIPEQGAKEKSRFSLREQAVQEIMASLDSFLHKTDLDEEQKPQED